MRETRGQLEMPSCPIEETTRTFLLDAIRELGPKQKWLLWIMGFDPVWIRKVYGLLGKQLDTVYYGVYAWPDFKLVDNEFTSVAMLASRCPALRDGDGDHAILSKVVSKFLPTT